MIREAPSEPSKEELIALIAAQRAELAALKAQIAELERRLGFKGLQGIEWAILRGHSGGSMQVSTLRRKYSSSRSP